MKININGIEVDRPDGLKIYRICRVIYGVYETGFVAPLHTPLCEFSDENMLALLETGIPMDFVDPEEDEGLFYAMMEMSIQESLEMD